ncbi:MULTISPECIES: type IV pilus secretin PilQ [Acinetobacter]|uniref:Pilus assembly protein PilQ n=1 Tax=Acinetobacter pittii TaxID=48296 RepID=A0A4Y3J5U5_ACIPI|nr:MULTISPECIES: type IV pilus secretin PilQ [Acinetobacter]MDA3453219.1 type IV pilus secretin PilQ [Acinetobacter sp. AOR43_HL]GEA66694.1 pilus assembly protein PilQ [Acinetobacter pittii]
MNHVFRQFSMGAVAIAIMQVASAQVSMTNIVPMQITGQGTEIRVIFDGLPPQPQAYQLENPSRLILDFNKAQQNLIQSKVAIKTNEASSVDVSSDDQRSRLTVNLKEAGAFTTRIEGNTFILKINSAQAVVKPVSASAMQTQGVSNIGFQRGSQGEGLIVIDLLGGNTPVDVQQQGSKVVVRTLGSKIPTHLAKRLNVNDFATPVSTIESYNEKGNGVITIQSTGSYEYMAYQAENKLTISLKRPQDKNVTSLYKTPNYSGNKLSLDFQDIEVRRVLQLLADFTGINMVAADSVQGNITLRLKDVPWDQALDIILKTKNLDKRRNGNVIWIAPVAELIKAEEEEAKAVAQSVKLAPLQTEYIQLKYAQAQDIMSLITQGSNNSNGMQRTSDGGNSTSTNLNTGVDSLGNNVGSLLSPRGTITQDDRTNTLIINDTAQSIDQIRKMIDLLDVQVKQVMVEARIVRASTSFTKELGVKWGILSQGVNSNNNLLVGGSDTTLWNLREPDDDGKYTIERPDNLNVDLGVTNPAGSIAFGLISMSDFMLDLELSALQADGYGEVISTPKVMTADKQPAKVATGQQVPYQTTTNSAAGATASTSFKDALLSLDVTPNITPDGKIQMKLDISKDSVSGAAPNGELILNKNNIKTNVLVNNGETVILGGVFEQTTLNSQTKVPFFGDLPGIGRLFRKDQKSDDKQELLIFVTPRIVNDTLVRNH